MRQPGIFRKLGAFCTRPVGGDGGGTTLRPLWPHYSGVRMEGPVDCSQDRDSQSTAYSTRSGHPNDHTHS